MKNRYIRVFLSSVFRETGVERELLKNRVFPNLRKKFPDITIDYIDLIWGILSEESARGEVAKLCLEEIYKGKETNLFFVGFLGNLYGSTMDSANIDFLLEDERFANFVKEYKSASFTEIEIRYGIQENSKERTLFYFKKDSDAVIDNYRKLENLKYDIKEKFEVTEYTTNEIASLVEDDLTKQIKSTFIDLVEVDNKFVFQNESNPHLKFALAKLVNFTINTDIKKSVYNFLLSDKEFLVLYGESGIGKSSIMADISSSWKFSFSNMYTFEYYVGWGKKLSKEDIFYSLVEFLRANLFPKDMKYEESSNISFLLKEYIDEVPEDIEVLILIDALDQLKEEDSQALLYFFIQNSRKNFKFIFSNLFPYEHSKIDILKVEKYRDREKKIFIEKYLEGRYGKRLPDSIIEDILILPQTNNFLYLKILLNELIVKARFETLETLFDYYSKAKDSTELFYLSFLRMEDTYGELIVKEILSIIYFSKDGVSENTLLDIINFESDDFSQAEIYPFLSFINEYLIRIEGNIKIFHKVFEEAIRNHYLKDKKFVIDIRSKIGNYLQRFKKESGEEIAENLFESREVPHNRYNFIRSMTDIRIFLGTDIEKTVERFSVFPEPSRFHTTIFHNLKNKKSKLLKDEILLKEYIEHIFNLTEVTIQYFPDNISKMKDVINFYIQSLDKFGKNPLHIANLRMSLGKVLEHEGHYQRGLDTLQLSLNTYRKYEEEHPNISIIYEYFGNIYKKQKNFFESEKNFLNAINFFKQYLELEELNIGFLYKGLGDVYIEQYKYAKKNIWQEYQRELQKENSEKVVILEPVFRKKSPKVDRKKELQNSYLDKLQREKDSLKKSEEYYNDSMDYLKTILTPLHKEVKEIYSNMLFSFVELEFEKSLERLIKSYRHDIDSLINQDNKSKTQFKKDVILEVKKMKSEVLKF